MIPSLREWKENTNASRFRRRSAELRAVDDAIEAYHAAPVESSRILVHEAWQSWKAAHASGQFRQHARNRNRMLEILDAEFVREAETDPQHGAISHWLLTLPADLPNDFIQLPPAVLRDRIDKGIVNAQSVLAMVCERLRSPDADTRALVNMWFGNTEPSALKIKFDAMAAAMYTNYKFEEQLTVRWDQNPDVIAAALPGENTMAFGRDFFDDDVVDVGVRLHNRPNITPEQLANVQAHGNALSQLNTSRDLLAIIRSWVTAAPDAATFGECMDRAGREIVKNNANAASNKGYRRATTRDETLARLAADEQQYTVARAAVVAELNAVDQPTRITAAGTVIHEVSHMILRTQDVPSPLFADAEPCYGVLRCAHLASVRPLAALGNADNYRLFAESCMTPGPAV